MLKYSVIPILFLLTLMPARAQQDTIEVKVKLITNVETLNLPPYCGHMMWKLTFEFEVLEVLSGTYTDDVIKVSINCPREAVEFKSLVNGGEYQYHLTKRMGSRELSVGEKQDEQFLGDYERVYLN